MARATAKLGLALRQGLRRHRPEVMAAVRRVQMYDEPHFADLGDFARRLPALFPTGTIPAAARRVLQALRHAIVYNGRVGVGVRRSTGLSLYLPQAAGDLAANRTTYRRLAFHGDHPEWLTFLEALHG